jgi:hypothetical protein
MKDQILLIAGCSHTAGFEIDGSDDSPYNRQHSFGNLLAAKLNRRPINIGHGGLPNSGIARSVLSWFHEIYDPNTMNAAVLICWTESTRIEVPGTRGFDYFTGNKYANWFDSSSNGYYKVNLGLTSPNKQENDLYIEFQKFVTKNPIMMEIQCANYIIQLQNFFKAQNVPYLMSNAMHMFTLPQHHLEKYLRFIDTTAYYKMTDNTASFFWKYRNLGYENPKAKYWHHSEIPHSLYCEELYKFIGDNHVLSTLVAKN